jgi:hypothetical protein
MIDLFLDGIAFGAGALIGIILIQILFLIIGDAL